MTDYSADRSDILELAPEDASKPRELPEGFDPEKEPPLPDCGSAINKCLEGQMEEFAIGERLPGCYYVRDFYTKEEAASIPQEIKDDPMIPTRPADYLVRLWKKLVSNGYLSQRPSAWSVNQFDSPDYELIPHRDGAAVVAIILALESHTRLDFYHSPIPEEEEHKAKQYVDIDQKETPVGSLLLEPNSITFLTGDCFRNYVHGIKRGTEDEVTADLLNRHLITPSLKDGEKFQRAKRISIVVWEDSNVCQPF